MGRPGVGAVLTAVAVAGLLVRRMFGYSFATWRFHLRGETIRSAHDVGWIRNLTVDKLMRPHPGDHSGNTGYAA